MYNMHIMYYINNSNMNRNRKPQTFNEGHQRVYAKINHVS